MRGIHGRITWAAIAATATLALAACGDDEESGGGGGAAAEGGTKAAKIALLLPESKTARYEAADRPFFEAKMKELCANCEVLYSNADQDAAKQQQQAEAAITNGAKVMVLDPVDSASAGSIVARAKQSKIPVISYDRLITGANADIDYYISFDNEQVGKLQGESLLGALGGTNKPIVMINGAPTDNNAKLFKKGAHSVLDGKVDIVKEYDTPDWSPDKAQSQMEQAITSAGKDGFDGVLAANDGTAGGAIAAMKGNGVDPSTKPTTGQDAELAGVQRVLIGEQFMTVYKAAKPEAEAAAQLAFALSQGKPAPSGLVNTKVNNEAKDVPSVILKPVAVTKDNIKDTVIKDGWTDPAELCTGRYAKACTEAGIN